MHSRAAPLDHGGAPAATTAARLQVPAWMVWAGGITIVLCYVGMLQHIPLTEPDEARYAEIAREMLERADWVTPHLNYVKYFEKPPLIYWLTAINFTLFGMSEFVARLWPALFGVLGIVTAAALGRSMFGKWTGCVAAALLAATPFYYALAQTLVLDMPLSALMGVALGAFWFAYREGPYRRAFVLLLYVATALAVLTKGPVAVVLTGGIIGAFLLLRGDLRALRWAFSPLGIVLFLLIALPWFVLVNQRNPEFFDFFVIKQHFDRFARPDEHRESIWFFVPIVLGGMLPWTAMVLLAPRIVGQFAGRLVRRQVSAGMLYCLVWSGVVFAFFSLSGSKLATYVLPMFCPLAILLARFFQSVIERGRHDVMRRSCIVFLVLAGCILLGALITREVVDDWRVAPIVLRLCVGTVVLAATGGIGLALLRRGAQQSLAVLLGGMLALQVVAISGRTVAPQYRPLGMLIRQQTRPDDLTVIYQHYIQGVTFYGQRRSVMVAGRGELDFGSHQGDQRAFFWDTDAQLVAAWRSPRRVFLIVNRSELEQLRPLLQPTPRHIAGQGKKVLVVNFS